MPSSPARAAVSKSARKPVARTQPADAVRATLSPDSWVDAATTLLVDEGIDSVRVDVLARRLGVTRGSFYWHFKDRQDLLRHVLKAWRKRATEQVTARFESRDADPHERVRDLISLPFRGAAAARAARIELAIRAWARRDDVARQAVDEADASRMAYQAQVFSSLGFSIAEARMRAFVLYSCQVAESLLYRQGTVAQRQDRSRFLEQLIHQRLTR